MTGEIQLALPLSATRPFCPGFLVGPSNEAAFGLVTAPEAWPGPVLVLAGPAGCGKSVLLRAFARLAPATLVSARDLSEAHALELGTNLQRGANVAIDDLDELADPAALFHLINVATRSDLRVLLAARQPPALMRLSLKDLETRLKAAPLALVDPPDDDLLRRLLYKHFEERQLAVDDGVVAFLILRMERSAVAASQIAERLDQASLRARRPITIDLARRVMDAQG